ncbi:MAG: protein kinase [Thermoanaerobaculia bacterium]
MSTDPRLPEFFEELSELPEEARAERLRNLSESDPELATELGGLLAVVERHPGRLEDSGFDRLAVFGAISEAPPAQVGSYRIVREIGRGGMGRVYLAEQKTEAFRRRVALKLLDASDLNPAAVRRFRDEVRILASLDCSGIARFLDGGRAEDGTWFLALEYVEGESLLEAADRRQLSVEQRIDLFIAVLDAVAYAHERHVVHRDLKSSNIMVGADGSVKLLDFGISKLLDPELELNLTLTRTEVRAFTPAYASPEQFRGEPVSAASDVYSAGVLLYELLSGVRPFAAATSAADLERAVLDAEPAPPSTAVRRLAAALSNEAPPRPPAAALRLDRDLDAICLKALRKAAQGRYGDAAEFAADLRRYRKGGVVEARQGAGRYRLERFARRHRRALVTGIAFALTLAVALVATIVAIRSSGGATRQRAEPAPRPFPFSPGTAPKLEEAERSFNETPASVEAGAVYAMGLQRAGRFKEAAVIVTRLRQIPGQEHDPLIDYVDALIATGANQPQRALILLDRALDSAISGARGELVAQIRATRGRLFSTVGRREEARAEMELARAAFVAAGDSASLARVYNDLAIEAAQGGDLAQAESLFEQALAASGSNRGAALLNNLGNLAVQRGRPDIAEARFAESIPIARESGRPSRLGFALREYSEVLRDLGRPVEAERALAEALVPLREADDQAAIARALCYGALADIERGRRDGVETVIGQMEGIATSIGSSEPLALAELVAGELAFATDDLAAARSHLEEAARILKGTSEADSSIAIELRAAEVALMAGDFGAAEGIAEKAIAPLRGRGESASVFLGETLLARAEVAGHQLENARRRLTALGGAAERAPSFRLRLAFLNARGALSASAGDLDLARADFAAAIALVQQADWRQAEKGLRRELATIESSPAPPAPARR